ncbi:hypothetical protein MTO96_021117 [Rhipicephalus appendiculatus]
MAELNRSTGARSSSSSNDQRRRDQDTEGKPLPLKRFLSRPASPPPPTYRESELSGNTMPHFTEAELARAAARHFGQAHLEDQLVPELQGRLFELRDQHVSGTPSVWDRLCRLLDTLKDQRRNPRWMFVFGMTVAFFLLVVLIFFLYPHRNSPPSDFPAEEVYG